MATVSAFTGNINMQLLHWQPHITLACQNDIPRLMYNALHSIDISPDLSNAALLNR